MRTIKIFLASSSDLKTDRKEFEIFINRKNKRLVGKGVFLKLIIWEDFLDVMSQTGLQETYNKAIIECDIFVMLFHTKVGKYTREEFETAFGHFQKTNRPFIFTYFKNNFKPGSHESNFDSESLGAFKNRLQELKHYCTIYQNIEGLREHFWNQIEKLSKQIGDSLDPKGNRYENQAKKFTKSVFIEPIMCWWLKGVCFWNLSGNDVFDDSNIARNSLWAFIYSVLLVCIMQSLVFIIFTQKAQIEIIGVFISCLTFIVSSGCFLIFFKLSLYILKVNTRFKPMIPLVLLTLSVTTPMITLLRSEVLNDSMGLVSQLDDTSRQYARAVYIRIFTGTDVAFSAKIRYLIYFIFQLFVIFSFFIYNLTRVSSEYIVRANKQLKRVSLVNIRIRASVILTLLVTSTFTVYLQSPVYREFMRILYPSRN